MSNKINFLALVVTVVLGLTLGSLAFFYTGEWLNYLTSQGLEDRLDLILVWLLGTQFLAWSIGTWMVSIIFKKADFNFVAAWVAALVAVPTAVAMVYLVPVSLYGVPYSLVPYVYLLVLLPRRRLRPLRTRQRERASLQLDPRPRSEDGAHRRGTRGEDVDRVHLPACAQQVYRVDFLSKGKKKSQ